MSEADRPPEAKNSVDVSAQFLRSRRWRRRKMKSLALQENLMDTSTAAASSAPRFELRFQPLSHFGRGFAFPCDERGEVPLNDLSDRLRDNYLYARAVVGAELSWPVVNRLAA
jgi:hypothetical protein